MPLKQLFLRKKTIADKTQKQKYSLIQIVDIIEKEKLGAGKLSIKVFSVQA